MYDSVLHNMKIAKERSEILKALNLEPKTDDPNRLCNIMAALSELPEREVVVLPLYPRTRNRLAGLKLKTSNLKLISPVGYLDMLMLEQNAKAILTDSGGMQKEAYFFGVPCVTMRTETEWIETVEAGWNVVVGADRAKIIEAVRCLKSDNPRPKIYGDGRAGKRIASIVSCK